MVAEVVGGDGYWWASLAFACRTCVFCSGLELWACLKLNSYISGANCYPG